MSHSMQTGRPRRLPSRSYVPFALLLLACLWTPRANGQDANPYGKQGRTVIIAGTSAYRSNLRRAESLAGNATWATNLRLTLVHFVTDKLALGGTLIGQASGLQTEPSDTLRTSFGADLDVVGHVPLTDRLSIRPWLFGGVRGQRRHVTNTVTSVQIEGGDLTLGEPGEDTRSRWVVMGVSLRLLVHLSSSTAISLGPDLSLTFPLKGKAPDELDYGLSSSISYAFGPDSEHDERRVEDSTAFSTKGRRAPTLSVSLSDSPYVAVGMLRFVRNGLAPGGYVNGGSSHLGNKKDNYRYAGAGAQMLYDRPFASSVWSIMPVMRMGYAWKSQDRRVIYDYEQVLHELQFAVSTYLGLHLHEALVLGVGPAVDAHFPLGGAESAYYQAGLGSILVGSF